VVGTALKHICNSRITVDHEYTTVDNLIVAALRIVVVRRKIDVVVVCASRVTNGPPSMPRAGIL